MLSLFVRKLTIPFELKTPKYVSPIYAGIFILLCVFQNTAYAQNNWTYRSSTYFIGNPGIAPNGDIIVTGNDDNVYSISPSGELNWKYQTSEYDISSPTVTNDGSVYVTSFFYGAFIKISSTGELIEHRSTTEAGGSVAIGANNLVHAGSIYGLSAYSQDGDVAWSAGLNGWEDIGVTIAADGTLYIPTYNVNEDGSYSRLYALTSDGQEKWHIEVGDDEPGEWEHFRSRVGIDEQGNVYIGSAHEVGGFVRSFAPDGTRRWSQYTSTGVYHTPVIDNNGNVYVTASERNNSFADYIYAFDQDGRSLWNIDIKEGISFSPVVAQDGSIYFATKDGTIREVNSSGRQTDILSIGSEVTTGINIADNGTLYFGTRDGRLHAITKSNGGLATSQWPIAGGNALNFGRLSNQTDFDMDGITDDEDLDDDGDSVPDTEDEFPLDPNEHSDFDGDGIGDNEDTDDDNDGVEDNVDSEPFDASIGNSVAWSFATTPSLNNALTLDHSQNLVISSGKSITSYTNQGELLWSSELPESGMSEPTISLQGDIYATYFYPGGIFALDSSGQFQWEYKTSEAGGSPAVAGDGTIYFGTVASNDQSSFYALNRDGTLKWSTKLTGWTDLNVAMDASGIIYAPAYNVSIGSEFGSMLHALSKDGELLWSANIDDNLGRSIALGSEGDIFLGSNQGNLYKFSSEGKKLWGFETSYLNVSQPAIDNDGNIYFGTTAKSSGQSAKLFAVNTDGELVWDFEVNGSIKSAPLLTSNGDIYFGTSENRIFLLNSEGVLQREIPTDSAMISAPTILTDGTILFGSEYGTIYALNEGSGQLANSAWPKANNNQYNNANADLDGDLVSNLVEQSMGLDPTNADSDSDQVSDGAEIAMGRDPLTAPYISTDFDANYFADQLFRDSETNEWTLRLASHDETESQLLSVPLSKASAWEFSGTGDFNFDGKTDVLLQNQSSGRWYLYNMDGERVAKRGYLNLNGDPNVNVKAIRDFNNDGKSDLLLRDSVTGFWSLAYLDNQALVSNNGIQLSKGKNWDIAAVADLSGNGSVDIVLRNSASGAWYAYFFSEQKLLRRGYIRDLTNDTSLMVFGSADFNGDGKADILLSDQSTTGWQINLMNGSDIEETISLSVTELQDTDSVMLDDFNGDGQIDIAVHQPQTKQITIFYLVDGEVTNDAIFEAPGLNNRVQQLLQ